MDQTELKYWLAFAKLNILRHRDFLFFKNRFPKLEKFWQASYLDLLEVGLPERIAQNFIRQRKLINPETELSNFYSTDMGVLTYDDTAFPSRLKEISCPPLILFYRGDKNILSKNLFAIVGTRIFSRYGELATKLITQEVIDNQLTPVSGLALGIDAIVHDICNKNNFPNVAVLGSGIDDKSIYPRKNFYLAQEIIEKNGILLSEYAPGTQALKQNFPARNRLISGLSLGTLVTEAKEKSGALITAHFALEQNREVFALPGGIDNINSIGTNNLIKKGAKLVSNINDILEELNISKKQNAISNTFIKITEEEKNILTILGNGSKHIDEIAQLCHKTINEINVLMLELEMKGAINHLGDMNYSLKI